MMFLLRKIAISLFCILFFYQDVTGTDDLIWAPYYQKKVPEGCLPVPGQNNVFIGLLYVELASLRIEGYIPITITNGSNYANVTIDSATYSLPITDDIPTRVLCGISNSQGKLEFVFTTSTEFDELFGTNREPIQLGWEANHSGQDQDKWYNGSLYGGYIKFNTPDDSLRSVVGKIYRNANDEKDNKFYFVYLGRTHFHTSFYTLILNKE